MATLSFIIFLQKKLLLKMAPKLHVTILSALGLAIGLALLILSAVLDGSYYAFCALIPLLMLAFPVVFCLPKGDSFSEETFFEMCGYFLVGFFLCSVIGSVVIMYRVEAISGKSLILSLIGMVVMAASIIWFSKADSQDSY